MIIMYDDCDIDEKLKVESQPTASVEVEYDNETSYIVRIVRYLWFSEVMDILTESGLGPNPTLLIKNLRLLYGDVFNEYYTMFHLEFHGDYGHQRS